MNEFKATLYQLPGDISKGEWVDLEEAIKEAVVVSKNIPDTLFLFVVSHIDKRNAQHFTCWHLVDGNFVAPISRENVIHTIDSIPS